MKSGLWTIFRKELARFFGDKRMVVGTILLPGLLIFVMYTFMGSALTNQFTVDEDFIPKVGVVDLPDSLNQLAEGGALPLELVPVTDAEQGKAQVTGEELDVLAVFPDGFDQAVAAYTPASGERAPAVALYYCSARTESQTAYSMVAQLLDGYESTLANKFDVNSDQDGGEMYDLSNEDEAGASFLSSLLPMLLLILLFSGSMAVAPESIAGEKERGTIATMLITPVKRSHLALGKILALSLIALLSGLSSTLGTLLSIPNLIPDTGEVSISLSYTPAHYAALAVVVLVTVLLIVACVSLLSAFAKTVKEAQTYVTPLMMVVMVVGMTAMFGDGASTQVWAYLIPLYNSVQCISGIFTGQLQPHLLALAAASNLCYTALGVWVLTRMFHSERVMFQR